MSLSRVHVLYLAKSAMDNYHRVAVNKFIWGYKKDECKEEYRHDDIIVFGCCAIGTKIRVPWDQWRLGSIKELAWAYITSNLYKDNNILFCDEQRRNQVIYKYRFSFRNLERKKKLIRLSGDNLINNDVSELLRKSAQQGTSYFINIHWPPKIDQ